MDTFSRRERRRIMQQVRSTNTSAEIQVRSILHRMGYRFSLYRKDLPGSPDIVLPRYKTVVFVHGCFWHRHRGCKRATTPATRREYWLPKFERTVRRDRRCKRALGKLGWKAIVVWECQLRNPDKVGERLHRLIGG